MKVFIVMRPEPEETYVDSVWATPALAAQRVEELIASGQLGWVDDWGVQDVRLKP